MKDALIGHVALPRSLKYARSFCVYCGWGPWLFCRNIIRYQIFITQFPDDTPLVYLHPMTWSLDLISAASSINPSKHQTNQLLVQLNAEFSRAINRACPSTLLHVNWSLKEYLINPAAATREICKVPISILHIGEQYQKVKTFLQLLWQEATNQRHDCCKAAKHFTHSTPTQSSLAEIRDLLPAIKKQQQNFPPLHKACPLGLFPHQTQQWETAV